MAFVLGAHLTICSLSSNPLLLLLPIFLSHSGKPEATAWMNSDEDGSALLLDDENPEEEVRRERVKER